MFTPEIGVMNTLMPDASNIDHVATFGLHCTQVCCWDQKLCTKEIARTLKQRAADAGVRITAMWSGYSGPACWNFTEGPVTLGLVPPQYRAMRLQELKNWADFAAEAGAPAIITHYGFLPENMTDPEYAPVLDSIREIGGYCKERGIGFWFETGQETPVTLLRFIEDSGLDNLGINLDTANVLMYGKGNPIDSLRVFGKYVRSTHIKDGCTPTNGKQLGHQVRLGEGMVNFPAFLPLLLSCGYTGDLIIEREIEEGEERNKDIRDSIAFLKRYLP